MKTILIILGFVAFVNCEGCRPSGVECINAKEYQLCVEVKGVKQLVGKPRSCPDDTYCKNDCVIPCKEGLPPTTTTPAPVTAPPCNAAAKYPAQQCNQYYECVWNWFWWESRLQTCPEELAYNVETGECTSATELNCNLEIQ